MIRLNRGMFHQEEASLSFRRALFIGMGIALFIGFLSIPIGNEEKHRSGPFEAEFSKTYQIENEFGRIWQSRIQTVTHDSLFEWDGPREGKPLSQIARISLDGRVYYLNPEFPLRKGEKQASEGRKWSGEERSTVGSYLFLIVLDAMGMIH